MTWLIIKKHYTRMPAIKEQIGTYPNKAQAEALRIVKSLNKRAPEWIGYELEFKAETLCCIACGEHQTSLRTRYDGLCSYSFCSVCYGLPMKDYLANIPVAPTRKRKKLGLVVGATVRITKSYLLAIEHEQYQEKDYTGLDGILACVNDHNTDGDFYGVVFQGETRIVYFWADELGLILAPDSLTKEAAQPPTDIQMLVDWLNLCLRQDHDPNHVDRKAEGINVQYVPRGWRIQYGSEYGVYIAVPTR